MFNRQRLEDKARWSDFWEELQAKGPKGTLGRGHSSSEEEYWSTRLKHLLGCEGIVTLTGVGDTIIDLQEDEAYRIIADYNLVPTADRNSGIDVYVVGPEDTRLARTGGFVNVGLSSKIECTLMDGGTLIGGGRRVTTFFSHNCHSGYNHIDPEYLRTFASMTAALLVRSGCLHQAEISNGDKPTIVSAPIDIVVADIATQLYCALGTQQMTDYDAARRYLEKRPSMLVSNNFMSQAMREWYRIRDAAVAQLKDKVKVQAVQIEE